MATLPEYVCIEVSGYGEKFDPSVQRTEMERGVAKQRPLNKHVMQEVSCSLLFKSPADAAAFEDWYFDHIVRIGFFDFVHPRTGATHNGRFKGGDIGTLAPVNNRRHKWRRAVTLEYLR